MIQVIITMISLGIAFLSVLISFGMFYKSYLSKFNLKIIPITDVCIARAQGGKPPLVKDFSSIGMGFSLINEGSIGGILRNIRLDISNKDKWKKIFFPIGEIETIQTTSLKNCKSNLQDFSVTTYIDGKSSVKRIFSFFPVNKYHFMNVQEEGIFNFEQGKYSVEIFVSTEKDDKWISKYKDTFTLYEDVNILEGKDYLTFFDSFREPFLTK